MSVTIYRKDNGNPIIFAHMIDAKESVAGGFYTWNDPTKEKVKEVPKKKVVEKPKKEEPVVEDELEKEEPVVEKVVEEPKEDETEKPIRKINPRLIRK